jgi:hypothetical protein
MTGKSFVKANQMFEINFVNHELFFKIKTGYIQTDECGVNTHYKSLDIYNRYINILLPLQNHPTSINTLQYANDLEYVLQH